MYNRVNPQGLTRKFHRSRFWLYPTGYYEQEPPPFWELLCEVTLWKTFEKSLLDFAPQSLFAAVDLIFVNRFDPPSRTPHAWLWVCSCYPNLIHSRNRLCSVVRLFLF